MSKHFCSDCCKKTNITICFGDKSDDCAEIIICNRTGCNMEPIIANRDKKCDYKDIKGN